MLSGDLNYLEGSNLVDLKTDIAEVERMLKALIRSLEHKHSDP